MAEDKNIPDPNLDAEALEEALAAQALEAAPEDVQYDAGRFTVAGTDLHMTLADVAQRQPERRIEQKHHHLGEIDRALEARPLQRSPLPMAVLADLWCVLRPDLSEFSTCTARKAIT